MSDLATRLARHPRFRWPPGMLVSRPGHRIGACLRVQGAGWQPWGEEVPDLADPATAGCLVAMLAEDGGCPRVTQGYGDWEVTAAANGRFFATRKPTPGEALAAALLWVWVQEVDHADP